MQIGKETDMLRVREIVKGDRDGGGRWT